MNVRWSADELLLVAKRIGSGEIYDVEVAFAPRGHHRDLVDARCSCPVGYYCKHTVALLITESRDPSTATPGYPVQAPWRSVLGG